MKRSKKFKCCGIVSLVIGTVLVALGIAFPFIMQALIKTGAKQGAALTQDNEKMWRGIPGHFGILIAKYFHLYNCTNYEDVVFKGAQPIMEEFGPYIYKETDAYDDISYDHDMTDPMDSSITKKALNTRYNQFATYDDDLADQMDKGIDSKMYQINQAAQGVWWAAQNGAPWRLAINILYSVVIDGLGAQVAHTGAWGQLQKNYITKASDLNTNFFQINKLTDAQANAIYNDAYYGLSNVANYAKWDALSSADPVANLLIKQELKFYFGLTEEQMDEFQASWKNLYETWLLFVQGSIPSNYHTAQGVAYWQWAFSFMTKQYNQPPVDSVVFVVDTVTGYPEINYFKEALFDKKVNDQYKTQFMNVKLYKDFKNMTVNYEHLFNLTLADGTSAPDKSSLFNIDTISALWAVGQTCPDIIANNTAVLDVTVFANITKDLGLDQNEQTYLIYLWLTYTLEMTLFRVQDGGSMQMGISSQLGAQAIQLSLQQMEQELPSIVYAYQMVTQVDATKNNCTQIYKTIALDDTMSGLLCNDSAWNFTDPLATSYALVNIYMNRNTYNPQQIAAFNKLTNTTDADMHTIFYNNQAPFNLFMNNTIMTAVYSHYQATACANSGNGRTCSNRQLAYAQWASGSVLSNPLSSMGQNLTGKNSSYVNQFPKFTQGIYAPELSYYTLKSELPQQVASYEQVWNYLNTTRLFNLKIVGDILMNVQTPVNPFNTQVMRNYTRYAIIGKPLGGLFEYRTPREYIEGYTDPTIAMMSQLPVYMGGDTTNDPNMALNASPTGPKDNPVGFFQGDDDYKYVRRYTKWLDRNYMSIKRKDYQTIYDLKDIYVEPWTERLYLDGTDGMQFHPLLEDNTERLSAWVNDLSRNAYFDYSSSDTDYYNGLEMWYYYLSSDMMIDSEHNHNNRKFFTELNGTSNMATVMNAPIIASKGHYYQIADGLDGVLSKIVDHGNASITPEPSRDDTYLGIETLSGVCVHAFQRLQMNFYIKNDTLFNFFQNGDAIIPLTFVKRDSIITKDQVKDMLGAVYAARTAKTVGLIVSIVVGVLTVVLGIFSIVKFRKIKRLEDLGVSEKSEYNKL